MEDDEETETAAQRMKDLAFRAVVDVDALQGEFRTHMRSVLEILARAESQYVRHVSHVALARHVRRTHAYTPLRCRGAAATMSSDTCGCKSTSTGSTTQSRWPSSPGNTSLRCRHRCGHVPRRHTPTQAPVVAQEVVEGKATAMTAATIGCDARVAARTAVVCMRPVAAAWPRNGVNAALRRHHASRQHVGAVSSMQHVACGVWKGVGQRNTQWWYPIAIACFVLELQDACPSGDEHGTLCAHNARFRVAIHSSLAWVHSATTLHTVESPIYIKPCKPARGGYETAGRPTPTPTPHKLDPRGRERRSPPYRP